MNTRNLDPKKCMFVYRLLAVLALLLVVLMLPAKSFAAAVQEWDPAWGNPNEGWNVTYWGNGRVRRTEIDGTLTTQPLDLYDNPWSVVTNPEVNVPGQLEIKGSVNFKMIWTREDVLPPRRIHLRYWVRSNSNYAANNSAEHPEILDVNNYVELKASTSPTDPSIFKKYQFGTDNDISYGAERDSGKWHYLVINNDAHRREISLPTRSFYSSVAMGVNPNSMAVGVCQLSYGVDLLDFDLEVKRHDPESDPQLGFANSSKIAAGGKSSDEHKSDVRVTVSSQGVSISEVPMENFPVRLRFGNGINGANARFEAYPGPLLTDGNGHALLGTFHSSDKITATNPDKSVVLRLKTGLGDYDPKAYVKQKWDEFDEMEYEPFYMGTETSIPIKFRPKFNSSGPIVKIQKHHLKISITAIKLRYFDVATQEEKVQIISLKPNFNPEPGVEVIQGSPSNYLWMDRHEMEEDEDGWYSAGLIRSPTPPEDYVYEKIWFNVYDEDVMVPLPVEH